MNSLDRLIVVRTRYDHWAGRSGYSLLSEYLASSCGFEVREIITKRAKGADTENGCPHYPLPWYSHADQASECELHQVVAGQKECIVHFFDGEKGFYYSSGLPDSYNCQLIATYHQPPSILEKKRLLGDRHHLQRLDSLIILSESQRSYFENYIDPEKIHCIPHGVDTRYFMPSQIRPNYSSRVRILTVGFWLRDLELIAEIAHAFKDARDVVFQLVGLKSGVKNDAVAQTVYERLDHLPNVELFECLSDKQLLQMYQGADVLLLPLIDCTASNVLLEGMACGLPILTTDLPATHFYVPDDSGLFADTGDKQQFIRHLEALVPDSELRNSMGICSRKTAESTFAWDIVTKQYADMLRGLGNSKHIHTAKRQKRAICTVITSDYLVQALSLHNSAARFSDFDFFVLVADHHFSPEKFSRTKTGLSGTATLLCLDDISCPRRDYINEDSLRWALKSSLMIHLLEKLKYDAVIFADNDLCFFQSCDFLFDALRHHSVILTPHWRPIEPSLNEIQFRNNFLHGLYNAGFIGACSKGLPALRWWQQACLYRCEKNESEGFYVDQRYLDIMPVHFDNVHIIKHKGCNVAEWNMEHLPRIMHEGKLFAENWPVVFIHFTGITIERIRTGMEPELARYYQEYLRIINQAEQFIQDNNLSLSEDESRLPEKCINSHTAWIFCAVIDFLTLPNFLMMLESVRSFHPSAEFHVMCSDYESYGFLTNLSPPSVSIHYWRELDSYQLNKQRLEFEEGGAREGDQNCFRRTCIPFFLTHLLSCTGISEVVFFDNRIVFLQDCKPFISELRSMSSCLALPRNMDDAIFIYLMNSRETSILLGLWKDKAVSVHAAGKGIPADIAPEHGPYWKRYPDRQGYIFQPCRGGMHPAATGKTSGGSYLIMAYDSSRLQIKDWKVRFLADVTETVTSSLKNRVDELMSSICRRYQLHGSSELEEALSVISVKDIVNISSKRGTDIKNFGRLIEENWQDELSDGLKAYLLYLMAVDYRQNNRLDMAMYILTLLTSSKCLMSDLYRGKINFHLGSLAELMNRPADAINYYQRCLLHAPFNSKASGRIKNIIRQ